MNCNCIHEEVCQYQWPILKAISPIMEFYVPRNPEWDRVAELVKTVCKYRIEKEAMDAKNKN